MVPAHTKETQVSLDPAVQTGGFAKVLTSIQGLQQRLDRFSADEADQAEANVRTLIEQLTSLHSKLQRLKQLQQFALATNSLISQIPEQNFDEVNLDSFENHPQLHAIIRSSKLIRMYKLMKAAKAGAESVSFDSEVGQLQFAISKSDTDASSRTPASSSCSEALFAVKPSLLTPNENEVPDGTAITLNPHVNETREQDWVFSKDAVLENIEPQFVEASVPEKHKVEHRSARVNLARSTDAENQSSPEASFDQQLLNDLIEAYGEFSPASKSPGEQPIVSKVDSSEVEENSPSELSELHEINPTGAPQIVPQNVADRRLLPTNAAANNSNPLTLRAFHEPTLPAVAQPVQSPGSSVIGEIPPPTNPGTDQPQPIQKKATVPSVTRSGELDRQLKSIIKDYGEYDLYSQQNSTNLKKAAIAAFALLALVLCGLYFFKTAPAVNSPARAIEPASASSNAR